MSTFFNSAFRTSLQTGGAANAPVTVRMYVWPFAPMFDDEDPRYTGITDVTTLSQKLGWGAWVPQLAPDQTVNVNSTKAPSYYIIAPTPFDLPATFPDTRVAAITFVYQTGPDATMVGKIMFTTNTLFSEEPVVLRNTDGITPSPDTVNVGATNNRWLMYWNVPTTGPVRVNVGEIVIVKGTPAFEPARMQHVWLYPQRINMIANPSFEAGVTHWKKNSGATLTRVSPGIDSAYYAHAASTPPVILESNTFPVMIRKTMDEGWTVHITARGDGELKIGLVTWSGTYDETTVDWGPVEETWALSPTSWLSFRTLRRAFDVSTACLRLETYGTFLDFDHVCCEPGFHPGNYADWPYFDGDTKYGALDDYSWYGEATRPEGTPTRQHKTYSCWYNHRRAVTGRLFQWSLADEGPGSVFTDEEVAAQGLVYNWVPAGTPVTQHLDVIYPGDPQSAIPDVVGPVTARQVDADDPLGVSNPWLAVLLPINSAVHEHTADTLALTGNIIVHGALHSHYADPVVLVKNLAVQDTLHANTTTGPLNLSGTIVPIPAASTAHAHTATTVELSSGLILIVQNSLHTHTAANTVLSVGVTTQDTMHTVTSGEPALT